MTKNGLSSEAVQSKPVKKIKVKSVEEESPEIRYFISKARIGPNTWEGDNLKYPLKAPLDKHLLIKRQQGEFNSSTEM